MAYFTQEFNQNLAKLPLKFRHGSAKLSLTFFSKIDPQTVAHMNWKLF